VSRTAYLRTIPAPSIVTQPEEQWVTAGKPATFQVVATGTNLSYEWRRNGLSIPGTNAPSYTIPRVSVDHAGIYDVLVRGCSGLLLSQGALLRVERVPGEVPSEDASRGDVLLTVTPNPLDGRGRIELRLPQGAPLHTVVGLRLYDLLGNPVEDLGDLEIVDGRGSAWINTRSLPSGAYYCRMDTPEWMGIRVVTVMR
jgi:hypothetical protein